MGLQSRHCLGQPAHWQLTYRRPNDETWFSGMDCPRPAHVRRLGDGTVRDHHGSGSDHGRLAHRRRLASTTSGYDTLQTEMTPERAAIIPASNRFKQPITQPSLITNLLVPRAASKGPHKGGLEEPIIVRNKFILFASGVHTRLLHVIHPAAVIVEKSHRPRPHLGTF